MDKLIDCLLSSGFEKLTKSNIKILLDIKKNPKNFIDVDEVTKNPEIKFLVEKIHLATSYARDKNTGLTITPLGEQAIIWFKDKEKKEKERIRKEKEREKREIEKEKKEDCKFKISLITTIILTICTIAVSIFAIFLS